MNRLHVGSGPHYAEGWTNLDLNNWHEWEKQPDVLASVFDMPFEDRSFDKVYCGHLLEHLKWEKVPDALVEMKRVLKPGVGTLCVVGPCMDKAIATDQPQWLLDEIPAGWNAEDDPEGFPHLWTATTTLTREALETTFDHRNIIEMPIEQIKLPEWPNTAVSEPASGSGMWQCAFIVRV